MNAVCVPCWIAGDVTPAAGNDGRRTACHDHGPTLPALCIACRYWRATNGPLCAACAGEDP